MDTKERIEIERSILRQFVEDVLKAGYAIVVDDGESRSRPFFGSNAVMAHCMQVDDEKLYAIGTGKDDAGDTIGYAHFVYGNEGYDVLSDHSVAHGFEALCKGANDLSNRLCALHGG